MISDGQLHSLAIFLGTLMMGMIVLYHFLAVNARAESIKSNKPGEASALRHKPAAAVMGTT